VEDWVRGLVEWALRPVRDLAQAVAERIAGVYGAFTGALARVRWGFVYWVDRGGHWVRGMRNAAVAITGKFGYILFVFIPARIQHGINVATRWAGDRITDAVNIARRELGDLRTWASRTLASAISALNDLRTWIRGQLGELWADFRKVREHVLGVLWSPTRLAAWAAGAIFEAILRYVNARAAAYGEIIWRRRKLIVNRTVDIVDDIVDRIF
jgi:hypothetical protein